MYRRIGTILAVLSISSAILVGCKKETPEKKAEVPQTAPAPQAAPASQEQAKTGEALFKQHCSVCHPEGGNVVKADKTLHGTDLKAHDITKPEDIVKIMRNPGQGMTKFDTATISDKDATAIANYVIQTFK